MDQIWALWPDEWFAVKQIVQGLRTRHDDIPLLQQLLELFSAPTEERGLDTLNYDEWRAICAQCGVTREKERDALLEGLSDLGTVVCFPRDARLRHLGVLNPEWVTRGIYPLLVEPRIAAQGGIVSMADLVDVLPADRYPKERHAWLIDLMKSFDLVFEDDRGRLLLPGQLPTDSPEWAQPEHWTGEDVLHLELRYDVLPESVISQFIVRRHKDARISGEWWRHGIALKRGDCEALVRAHVTDQESKIELRLRGSRASRHELLASIRETLRDPKDTSPPELYVNLGEDCAARYADLLIHAQRRTELDFIIAGRSVSLPLAPILDMVEAPRTRDRSNSGNRVEVNIRNEAKSHMGQDKSINISGSTLTNTAVGIDQTLSGVSTTIANAVDGELKTRLLELQQLTSKLLETPAVRAHGTVANDLQSFAAEATSANPRKKYLELSGKGLIEAAKTVGAMAPPIIAVVHKILELVSGAR